MRNQFVQVDMEHARVCLNGIGWNPAISNQTIPSGSRHLVRGESLARDLNEIFVNGQTSVLTFGGASVAQVIKMMKFQREDHLDTLVLLLGTNDVSRVPVTPEGNWEPLLVCLLNELKAKYRPRLVVLCTIPQNPEVGTPVVDFMNGNLTRWNEMTRSLVRSNPSELRLMDLENMLRMVDHLALTRDGIHYNTQQWRHWINDVFQTQMRKRSKTDSLTRTSSTGGDRVRGNVPELLANRLGPLAMETGAADTANPPATANPASTTGQSTSALRRRELNQAARCFGTVQIPAVGDNIRRTCQRDWTWTQWRVGRMQGRWSAEMVPQCRDYIEYRAWIGC